MIAGVTAGSRRKRRPRRVAETAGRAGRGDAVRTTGARSAPQRWKQACAIWLGAFPLNLLLSLLLTALPWWGDTPLTLRSLLMVSMLAPLMTFAVMPAVTRLLRPWLRRDPQAVRNERALAEALDALHVEPRDGSGAVPVPGQRETGLLSGSPVSQRARLSSQISATASR